MNIAVLSDQAQLLSKLRHSFRELREKMMFLNQMVHGELMTERLGEVEECADRLATGAFVLGTGAVDVIPQPTEIVVL